MSDPRAPLAVRADVVPFAVVGVACVIGGGLVAAVTRPLDLEVGSWAAAFLVLVGGVAQVGLGVGQAWLGAASPKLRWAELVSWNGAVALTIAGTVAGVPVLTSVAGAVLAVSLALFLVGSRASPVRPRAWLAVYRGLVTVVLVSIPVGLALAWVRHR